MVIKTLPNISAGNCIEPHLNFLKTTEKELNGAAIRLNRRKMGDILLIKKRKSIGPTQGKRDYKKVQQL